jgi:Uma2 family endonuclease
MTTTRTQTETPTPNSASASGTVAIPLAEFGKCLDDPDLDRWFEEFSERNSDEGQTYEISNTGRLLIMSPTGDPGSFHETELTADLAIWARTNGGFVRGPTARFRLPDGSRPGPDVSWVAENHRAELLSAQNRPFSSFAPDFIAEIKSPSNSNAELVSKINLFISHGTRLAWLIDAATRTVSIFRPGRNPEILRDPEFVDGDQDVLPGFRFAVRERIFDYMNDPQS